ncbi:GNAT family N-acetyltransferase [Planctomycetota bacterium]
MKKCNGMVFDLPNNRCSPTTLTGTVVTSRDQLNTYAHEWNELLASSRANTLFLTWEWVITWLDVVYPDAPLLIVAVREGDGRLVAIAPFYRSDLHLLGLIKYRSLRIIGDCQCGGEYSDIIIRSGFEDAAMMCVARELVTHQDAWDCMWIYNVAGWTGARERFTTMSEELGLHLHDRVCKFSSVRLPATHEAYLNLLSKKRRGYIRRMARRLHKSYSVELTQCDNYDELPVQLAKLFELHRTHWESVGQVGSFVRRPPMKRFYESFAPIALSKGWLRLYVLKVDGVPQAAQYGYVYNGIYHAVQEGYNPNVFEGIGNVLRNLLVRKCIEEGLKEYDFLGGFSAHKRLWGAEPRQGYAFFIGRKSPKNHLLFWKKIWPSGRFIQEDRPANQGRSHD